MEKKENKKINIRKKTESIKKAFLKVISIGKKTWFFTIVFFVVVFGFSLWIWWSCILYPSPNEQIIFEIQKEQKDFEMKTKKVEFVIGKIKERSARFQEASDHQINRKFFKSKEELFEELNPSIKSNKEQKVESN